MGTEGGGILGFLRIKVFASGKKRNMWGRRFAERGGGLRKIRREEVKDGNKVRLWT